jgi:hypothetical protein
MLIELNATNITLQFFRRIRINTCFLKIIDLLMKIAINNFEFRENSLKNLRIYLFYKQKFVGL